jgi:hypothetical protein
MAACRRGGRASCVPRCASCRAGSTSTSGRAMPPSPSWATTRPGGAPLHRRGLRRRGRLRAPLRLTAGDCADRPRTRASRAGAGDLHRRRADASFSSGGIINHTSPSRRDGDRRAPRSQWRSTPARVLASLERHAWQPGRTPSPAYAASPKKLVEPALRRSRSVGLRALRGAARRCSRAVSRQPCPPARRQRCPGAAP